MKAYQNSLNVIQEEASNICTISITAFGMCRLSMCAVIGVQSDTQYSWVQQKRGKNCVEDRSSELDADQGLSLGNFTFLKMGVWYVMTPVMTGCYDYESFNRL